MAARASSTSPTGSEGRDRPPKKEKMTGVDHRSGVASDGAVAKPFYWHILSGISNRLGVRFLLCEI